MTASISIVTVEVENIIIGCAVIVDGGCTFLNNDSEAKT